MQRLSESQRSFLREATESYHQSLKGSPAEEYLAKRGLGSQEIHQWFRLGYVEDPLLGHEMFRGMLAIPYIRWSQDEEVKSVVSIRYRCIEDHDHRGHGKYMTQSGDRPRLYNTLALLRPSPIIAITEGEIDAITSHVCGIPTVGVPGAHAWQPHFREPLLGYKTVFILADGDDAGMQFATTVAKTLPNAKIIPMPNGEDVNSLVVGKGKQALLDRLA